MRQWAMTDRPAALGSVLAQAIAQLGHQHFGQTLLDSLYPVLPAASCAVYRTGPWGEPAIFMSASHGVPDTTRACWRAYLSGPYRSDRTLYRDGAPLDPATRLASRVSQISHITAQEVPPEHRAKVYEAHGVAERVSIVEPQGQGDLFAINFYRHQHQRPFSDAQLGTFEQLAPALLALAHKHLALWDSGAKAVLRLDLMPPPTKAAQFSRHVAQLRILNPALTPRECEVCAGILQGLTFDGIACQLGLTLTTVKTYRNRAFARLGIHFRNQLFALVWQAQGA